MPCLTPCVCVILPRRTPDSSEPYTHVAILATYSLNPPNNLNGKTSMQNTYSLHHNFFISIAQYLYVYSSSKTNCFISQLPLYAIKFRMHVSTGTKTFFFLTTNLMSTGTKAFFFLTTNLTNQPRHDAPSTCNLHASLYPTRTRIRASRAATHTASPRPVAGLQRA